MCSNCSGDYENPSATQPEVVHGFAGMVAVEKTLHKTGYADMDVEYQCFGCLCGEPFYTKEELETHILDNCPHTDQVRWEPS